MACGENPKRVYAQARARPTRMGNVAGYRAAWIEAEQYRRSWDKWLADRKGDPPERDLGNGDARRGAARQHPRAEPLLPRRRDGADDRHRARSSATRSAPSTTASRPTRSPTCWRRKASRRRSGPTGAASRWRRSTASRRTCALVHARRRARDRALRRPVGIAAAEPGSGEGASPPARAIGIDDHRGRGDQVDHDQPGVGARPRRQDRLARAGQERRRRALVRRSVQRLHARREGLDRRRAAVRPRWIRRRSGAPTSSSASCRRPGGRDDAGLVSSRSSFALVMCRSLVPGSSRLRPCRRADDRHHRRHGVSGQRPADRERHRPHRDGKITRSARTCAVPAGATRIDATGKWVTPGLINAATALGVVEIGAVPDTNDDSRQGRATAWPPALPRLGGPQPGVDAVGAGAQRRASRASVVRAERRADRGPGGARRSRATDRAAMSSAARRPRWSRELDAPGSAARQRPAASC